MLEHFIKPHYPYSTAKHALIQEGLNKDETQHKEKRAVDLPIQIFIQHGRGLIIMINNFNHIEDNKAKTLSAVMIPAAFKATKFH